VARELALVTVENAAGEDELHRDSSGSNIIRPVSATNQDLLKAPLSQAVLAVNQGALRDNIGGSGCMKTR